MGQKPETKFRAKIRPYLEAIPNSWFESIQQKSICGTPDIIGCINGLFVGIELKATDGKLTDLQAYKIEKIVKAGGLGILMTPDNWEETLKALNIIAKKGR